MELLSQVYFWILFSTGIGISLWGFMKTRFKGYLLIAAFFLSPFVGPLFQEISYQIHTDEIQRMAEQQIKEMEHMLSEGHVPILTEKNVTLHIFESLLVLGLFLIIRNHKTEPIVSDNVG